jgi:hypothetical protein
MERLFWQHLRPIGRYKLLMKTDLKDGKRKPRLICRAPVKSSSAVFPKNKRESIGITMFINPKPRQSHSSVSYHPLSLDGKSKDLVAAKKGYLDSFKNVAKENNVKSELKSSMQIAKSRQDKDKRRLKTGRHHTSKTGNNKR